LNTAQKQAVDTIEGPVLVLAGPGTGKTQVVAMRVANILRRTQMRPSNILCLTFSTSGAKAMRERLRQIIGPDAYGVTVSTIHGFCNDLILSHPHIFEQFRALEAVSEIESLRIVRGLLTQLGVGSMLWKPAQTTDRSFATLQRIREMKREGITPESLRALAPLYQEEIARTPSGKKRSKETQSFQEDQRLTQQFEEFILTYEGYQAALADSHRYDREDMVLLCSAALQEHPWLLASQQERYQYLLVDEYQDTNGAQHRILELLTEPPSPEHLPNFFVVGDDDQAIYRFQGANVGNLLSFLQRFPAHPDMGTAGRPRATILTLTESYRCSSPILQAASTLIAHNKERLVGKIKGIEKQLASKVSGIRCQVSCVKQGKPVFLRFPTLEAELNGIATILREAHEEGVPWDEMAVLCRRNEELHAIDETLRSLSIPTMMLAKRDLLRQPVIRETIAILRAIEHPDHDAVLSAALACPTFHCHPVELAKFWIELQKRNHRKGGERERTSLRELLLATVQLSTFNMQLAQAATLIEELHLRQQTLTLPELVERVLKDSGLLPGPRTTHPDPEIITALQEFYEYVKQRSYEQKSLTLPDLLSDLDHYEQGQHLTLEYETTHLAWEGVQVMTAHRAKGMEFTLVIIPHLRYRNWGNRTLGAPLSLPDHLIFGRERSRERELKQEDERRLLYVAMTRAKNFLVLTCAETERQQGEVRDASVSHFLADLGETIEESPQRVENYPPRIGPPARGAAEIDAAFRAYLQERLEHFELSVTALNAFLEDPQDFLWTHLLLMPQAKAPHLAFGTAVHRALEERNLAWQRQTFPSGQPSTLQSHSEAPFTTEDLLQAFERAILEREVLTPSERAHYLHLGRKILERYASETQGARPLVLSAERRLLARYEDIPLVGKVDRIDLCHPQGQACRVLDYKTGIPKRSEEAVRREAPLFRQLVFYKLLCDRSPSFLHKAEVFTLDFLGNDRERRRVFDFEITEKETKELQEIIRAVWAKLIALDFTPL
jgi:DNA helicase-2/ATP-dependent DNA helicase PcrA